jgi:hypothetical protein
MTSDDPTDDLRSEYDLSKLVRVPEEKRHHRRRRRTWYAIVLDTSSGRICIPCGEDDTAENIEKRFEKLADAWHWSVRYIARDALYERLEDFRKRGLEALDRQVSPLEYGD